MHKTRTREAFTLIELLIVVAIIGILAAIAVPNFLIAQTKAKIGRMYTEHNAMNTAMMMYRLDYNSFHRHSHDLNQNVPLTTPLSYLASSPVDVFSSPVRILQTDQ